MKKTETLKEVLQPFRNTIENAADYKHFNPTEILMAKLKNTVLKYYPIVNASNDDYKFQLNWFNDLVSKFGLENDVGPEVFNEYIKEYVTETEKNPQKLRSDITNLRNELKAITETETGTGTKKKNYLTKVANDYLTKVANDYNNSKKDFKLGDATNKTSSKFNDNGEPHAHRVNYLNKSKDNFIKNIDAIIKPTVIASVVDSVTSEGVGDILLNDVINKISIIPNLKENDDFKTVKGELDDIVEEIDKKFPETDVTLKTVKLEEPKPAPKLDIASFSEADKDIEEVKPNPLQVSGINVDLIKPYKPNLQDASQILFEQSNVKPKLEIKDTDNTYDNPDLKPAARMKKIRVVDQKGKLWNTYKDILVPELEIASFPKADTNIEEIQPTPLQVSGINSDLIKPYKPNLQNASQILFEQSNVKPDEENDIANDESGVNVLLQLRNDIANEESDSSSFSITPIQSDEETVISDSVNTPEVPSSREFVSPKAYREGLKDYLENVNARYLDFKQAFIDSGIITEDNLKELAGVPSIIEKLRRDFSDSTKQLTKDVVQDWNDKLKFIKDLIAKHGATMQKQYRLEAKLNATDAKTEELMRELKANSTLAYLLKLPTSTYEKLPDSIKKACELYREKQNELNNYIASRKKLIPKRAMNKKISKPVSSNVLNPMLKRGYQVFQ